jgi:hypothetical protein
MLEEAAAIAAEQNYLVPLVVKGLNLFVFPLPASLMVRKRRVVKRMDY